MSDTSTPFNELSGKCVVKTQILTSNTLLRMIKALEERVKLLEQRNDQTKKGREAL